MSTDTGMISRCTRLLHVLVNKVSPNYQNLKVHWHAIQWFYVDFLRSKMAARRLEAVAPANKKQAFATLFSSPVSSFAINRRRGISQLPMQSHSSLGQRWALRLDQESENKKTSLSMKNGESSWKPKQACGAPRINLGLSCHSWSEDRSRLARLSQVSGAVAYISLQSTMYTTIIDRQDTCWARFAWNDARPPLFFPTTKGRKNHWIAWQCTYKQHRTFVKF